MIVRRVVCAVGAAAPAWAMQRGAIRGAALAAGFAVLFAAGCGGPVPQVLREPEAPMRGLWITRWDFRTADDVDRCLADAADLGFTDVFFQVRGQADAFYRSSLEPWGRELLAPADADSGAAPPAVLTDPGYDPLARAIAQARRRGLRLHAWVNVYPLWRGLHPPLEPDHPLNRYPDWRLHDDRGRPQPLNDHYVVANPADPAVQAHVVAVLRDLCARYDIDGLHLDYVRFVSDRLDAGRLWPGDAVSLARWRAAGGDGDPYAPPGRAAYRDWLREEITGLVARIAEACRAERPGLLVSAAVVRRPELARDTFLQDGVRWLAQGLVDRLLPMIYTRDAAVFAADLAAWLETAPAERLAPGIGVFLQEPEELPPQLAASRQTAASAAGTGVAAAGDAAATRNTAGWALFAYSSLCESVNPEQDRGPEAVQRRARLRSLLGPSR